MVVDLLTRFVWSALFLNCTFFFFFGRKYQSEIRLEFFINVTVKVGKHFFGIVNGK